jgi:hypothetical protein
MRIMQMMFEPFSKSRPMMLRLVALVLVLWLVGVGCMLGCEMKAAAAHKEESQAASDGESCAVASERDCCQKQDGAANIGSPTQTKNVSCCPLAGVSSDPARKISMDHRSFALAASGSSFGLSSKVPTPFLSYQLLVPDRGSTRLRCCVFLI